MSYLYSWKIANQPIYKIGHGLDPRSRMRDYCRRHSLQAEENSLHRWYCNKIAKGETLEFLLHHLLEESRMVLGDGSKPRELFHIPEGFPVIERAVQKVLNLDLDILEVDNSQSNWIRFRRLGEELRKVEEKIHEQHWILRDPPESNIIKNLRWSIIILATFLYFLFSAVMLGILAGSVDLISVFLGCQEDLLAFRGQGGGEMLLAALLIGSLFYSLKGEVDNAKALIEIKIEEFDAAKHELPRLQKEKADLERKRDGLIQRLV